MSDVRAVRVRISGRVQGVGFRVWAKSRAGGLGLSGWVANNADGAVEALFSGPAEDVEIMLAACRVGPRHAGVEAVEVLGPVEPVAGPFSIRS